jgi:diadenosine tetraphosphate (Ap4A) HIT family hydrolase
MHRCAAAIRIHDTDPAHRHLRQDLKFGPWSIAPSEVFASTPLSFAFVNLKPVVPGHVLVSPRRVAKRFSDLTDDEVSDLWALSRCVGTALEPRYGASSLTYTIQDGAEAGQTVAHVHVHVLPRRKGDFERNDEIYDAIDAAEKVVGAVNEAAAAKKPIDLDEKRRPRTPEEMAAEAAELRKLFQ